MGNKRMISDNFSGEITERAGAELISRMTQYAHEEAETVVLSLSTPGGRVDTAKKLHEMLTAERTFQLVTWNTSRIESMGNLLFLAGDVRVATREARFFFHPIKLEVSGGRFDLSELCEMRTESEASLACPRLLRELDLGIIRLTREEREVRTIIEARTRIKGAEITDLIEAEKVVDAPEALAMGIVHDLVSPSKIH